jgi:hypothetical protein
MKLVDSTIRYAIPVLGVAVRWLKEDLRERGVTVHLTEPCLRELVADAEAAAELKFAGQRADERAVSYVDRLRAELADRAEFVRAWTQAGAASDDAIDTHARFAEPLVRIARKFALPRAWRLSEPVAAPSRHPTPTYLYWASANSA